MQLENDPPKCLAAHVLHSLAITLSLVVGVVTFISLYGWWIDVVTWHGSVASL